MYVVSSGVMLITCIEYTNVRLDQSGSMMDEIDQSSRSQAVQYTFPRIVMHAKRYVLAPSATPEVYRQGLT
jgi:hypothetical protein